PGELFIGGNSLAEEYLKDEKNTKYSFIVHKKKNKRLYRTGDYGRYLPNGEIEFLGRKDNQVKLNGFRIELGEIEEALRKIDGIKEACVVKSDNDDDKQLIGFIVPTENEGKDYQLLSQKNFSIPQTINNIPIDRSKIEEVIKQRDVLAIKSILECMLHFKLFCENEEIDTTPDRKSVV